MHCSMRTHTKASPRKGRPNALEYIPHTREDIARALSAIGIDHTDELFRDIPEALLDPSIDLPEAMNEVALLRHLRGLAAKNRATGPNFLGGGVRRHFIPTVTPHLAMQSEFVTSYTPYQAEVAQGMLQATFEYQTMMAELTALPVSNASMYDGATAVAEAALVALRHTGRNRVVVSHGVHPETRQVLRTYLDPMDVHVNVAPLDGLATAVPELDGDTACLIVQNPNFLGYLEGMRAHAAAAEAAGALLVSVVDPLSLAVLTPPGEYGAKIAVGDGQTLGNPTNFGGPHFGFMVVAEELLRQMPGRIVGETVDADGTRAFVLTLQAREQHIRRSKAKSNICSNHQLTALMAAVNMSALGPRGLRDAAVGSVTRAHELADALAASGVRPRTEARFFNEFVLETRQAPSVVRKRLAERGIHAGVPVPSEYGLGQAVVLGASELTESADIMALVEALAAIGEAAPEVAHG